MARPKTAAYWVDLVGRLVEKGLSTARIVARVPEVADLEKRTDYPSERTIRRLVAEHGQLDEKQRRLQGQYAWPASHQSDLVPWDGARASLDLARYCESVHSLVGPPTARHALWFYRLRLASPTMPVEHACWIARGLAAQEYLSATGRDATISFDPGTLHLALETEPWAGEESHKAWNEAAKRQGIGDSWEMAPSFTLSVDGPEELVSAWSEMTGMSKPAASSVAQRVFGNRKAKSAVVTVSTIDSMQLPAADAPSRKEPNNG